MDRLTTSLACGHRAAALAKWTTLQGLYPAPPRSGSPRGFLLQSKKTRDRSWGRGRRGRPPSPPPLGTLTPLTIAFGGNFGCWALWFGERFHAALPGSQNRVLRPGPDQRSALDHSVFRALRTRKTGESGARLDQHATVFFCERLAALAVTSPY